MAGLKQGIPELDQVDISKYVNIEVSDTANEVSYQSAAALAHTTPDLHVPAQSISRRSLLLLPQSWTCGNRLCRSSLHGSPTFKHCQSPIQHYHICVSSG